MKYSFITLMLLMIAQVFMCHKYIEKENSHVLTQDSTIIGTWISTEDNNWKFEFRSDSTCISSYIGSSSDTCYYAISNTSPQCGISVPMNQYSSYLKLTNIRDNTDKTCYLINGITNTNFSISVINQRGALVFEKVISIE